MSVVAGAESAVDLDLRNLLEIMDEAGGRSHMPAECPLPGVASDCPRSRVQRAASSWTGDKNARCPAQPAQPPKTQGKAQILILASLCRSLHSL